VEPPEKKAKGKNTYYYLDNIKFAKTLDSLFSGFVS